MSTEPQWVSGKWVKFPFWVNYPFEATLRAYKQAEALCSNTLTAAPFSFMTTT